MNELGFGDDNFDAEPSFLRDRNARRGTADKTGWLARAKQNVFVAFLIDLVVIVVAALLLSLLVKTFLIRSFFVPSGSMLSTLQIDDRIIVNELVPNVVPIERGDVVVFKDPGGWLGAAPESPQTETNPLILGWDWFLSAFGLSPAPDSSQHLVKRVIGLPGDHVVCCDANKHLTINGAPITETYLDKGVSASERDFDVVVPDHKIWVMGDNRSSSADSRFHTDLPSKGFVDESLIVGRAFVVSWPLNHWQWLDNFSSVFKDVPQPKN
jgi:signal peptidase I